MEDEGVTTPDRSDWSVVPGLLEETGWEAPASILSLSAFHLAWLQVPGTVESRSLPIVRVGVCRAVFSDGFEAAFCDAMDLAGGGGGD